MCYVTEISLAKCSSWISDCHQALCDDVDGVINAVHCYWSVTFCLVAPV